MIHAFVPAGLIGAANSVAAQDPVLRLVFLAVFGLYAVIGLRCLIRGACSLFSRRREGGELPRLGSAV